MASIAPATSLVVDSYSESLDATINGVEGAASVIDTGIGAIGSREFLVARDSISSGSASIASVPSVGLLVSNEPGVDAHQVAKYGIFDDLNLNLAFFDTLVFSVSSLNLLPLNVEVTLTDGFGGEDSGIVSLGNAAPTPYIVRYNLGNFTMVDLSDIDMFSLRFDGPAGVELELKQVSFATTVPVPATLPLLLTGLVGIGIALRLRNYSV